MAITLNVNAKEFGNPLELAGNYVKLPFNNVRLSWNSGYAAAEKTSATRHFGGWAPGAQNFETDCAGFSHPYNRMSGPETWIAEDGHEYTVYQGRSIFAAPIATRSRWRENKTTGKGSSVTEMLVYLAEMSQEKKLIPYGPGVLSGGTSYWAGIALIDAFKEWANVTSEARRIEAPGVPTAFFYVQVGTFGDKRITKMVGKTGQQSAIVPAQIAPIDREKWPSILANYFVGDDVAAEMIALKAQAKEWLDDAKPKGKDEKQQGAGIDVNALLSLEDDFPG